MLINTVEQMGNRCGHKVSSPQFYNLPTSHKIRPGVICFAQNNAKVFYYQTGQFLKSLTHYRFSRRQIRSEARERDVAVLQVLLHYVDLATLRVGVPGADGSFTSFGLKTIAKKLGWRTAEDDEEDKQRLASGKRPRERGVKRVCRAIMSLKRVGYLQTYRRFERALMDGEMAYKGLPAIRCLSQKLFQELGISATKLAQSRKKAANRLKKKYQAYREKEGQKNLSRIMHGIGEAFKNNKSSYKKVKTKKRKNQEQVIRARKAALEQEMAKRCSPQELEKGAQLFRLAKLPENSGLSLSEIKTKYRLA